jgi:hypothetical protein
MPEFSFPAFRFALLLTNLMRPPFDLRFPVVGDFLYLSQIGKFKSCGLRWVLRAGMPLMQQPR